MSTEANPSSSSDPESENEGRDDNCRFCGCVGNEAPEKMERLLAKCGSSQEIEAQVRADLADCKVREQDVKGVVGLTIAYLRDLLDEKETYEELYATEAEALVDLCLYFLLCEKDDGDEENSTKPQYRDVQQLERHGYYITLWSFLYGALGLPEDTYAYFVLQFMQELELIEHGSGIRCASIDHSGFDKLNDERLERIYACRDQWSQLICALELHGRRDALDKPYAQEQLDHAAFRKQHGLDIEPSTIIPS